MSVDLRKRGLGGEGKACRCLKRTHVQQNGNTGFRWEPTISSCAKEYTLLNLTLSHFQLCSLHLQCCLAFTWNFTSTNHKSPSLLSPAFSLHLPCCSHSSEAFNSGRYIKMEPYTNTFFRGEFYISCSTHSVDLVEMKNLSVNKKICILK